MCCICSLIEHINLFTCFRAVSIKCYNSYPSYQSEKKFYIAISQWELKSKKKKETKMREASKNANNQAEIFLV